MASSAARLLLTLSAWLLLALTPLAYVTPADSLWFRSVYDDADNDVVLSVLLGHSVPATRFELPARGLGAERQHVPSSAAVSLVPFSALSTRPRSPPKS